MTTQMMQSMASCVYVEARDTAGHTLAQAVFTDWNSRPVPAVGDSLRCAMRPTAGGRTIPLNGRVVSRHFELQRDADDRTSVWVALVIVVADPAPNGPSRRPVQNRFSRN